MWPKIYKDYPPDSPLKKEQVTQGRGIIGCEMHELNGWGDTPDKRGPKNSRIFDNGYDSRDFSS